MASLRNSAAAASLDKQRLEDALESIHVHTADPQRVYSSLVTILDVLADDRNCAQLVDAVLSRADTVARLVELMRLYTQQEEMQWYLCRVLVRACTNSLRFQCQAGQRELWRNVFAVRSAHPGSLRVLWTSLELYEALLRDNELQVLKARPAQSLIQELLATIDRFSHQPPSGITCIINHCSNAPVTRSYEGWQPDMVIRATRVLAAIYASTRIQALVEEKHTEFATAIVTRLVTTIVVFLITERDTQLWLQLTRSMLLQHSAVAIPMLFLQPSLGKNAVNVNGSVSTDAQLLWFTQLLTTWRSSAAVVYDFAALLTFVFALPHAIGEHIDALTHTLLFGERSLLVSLSELLSTMHNKLVVNKALSAGGRGGGGQHQLPVESDTLVAVAALEIVRVLRQWSADATTRTAFLLAAPRLKKQLMATLVTELQCSAAMIQQQGDASCNSSNTTQQLAFQSALELLLLLQQLVLLDTSSNNGYSDNTIATQQLMCVLQSLRKHLDENVAAQATNGGSKSDSAVDALVRRALTQLEKTLAQIHRTDGSTRTKVPLALPSTSTISAEVKATATKLKQQSSRSLLTTLPNAMRSSTNSTAERTTHSSRHVASASGAVVVARRTSTTKR